MKCGFFSSPGHILPQRHFELQEREAHSCHLEKMQGVVVTAKVHMYGERLDVCLQERIGSEGGEIQGAAALSTSFQGRLTLPGISPLLCSLLPADIPSVTSRLLFLLHSALPWPITAFSNLMSHSTCLRPGLRHPLAQGNMRGNLMGSVTFSCQASLSSLMGAVVLRSMPDFRPVEFLLKGR